MSLGVGARLGHYAVTAKLGEGGMGEVWRATDTQLNRDVALKILPEAFAADPDRLARIQREAQVLASLNHPNIAQIHGIEEDEGTRALVLELVEGPTLPDRISKGPIPLDVALPIAKQIAEALEAAHEAGVIHRDLKPANIKVREDGTVKVLDFRLAKALDTTPQGDPSESPRLTASATRMGVIMGTAAYMSPEQASGSTVDKRADIWSFGVVLFEMLTGQRLFTGATVPHVLASVLMTEPDWSALPAETSSLLRRVLRRCLEKNRKERLHDIADARREIAEALRTPGAETVEGTVVPLSGFDGPEVGVAFSPDGCEIVYVVGQNGTSQLYRRRLNDVAAMPVAGTEGASDPFYSPDGQWVWYRQRGALTKVRSIGGVAVEIGGGGEGTWGANETIVFATSAGLWTLRDAPGATPELLLVPDLDLGERFDSPHFLPDGKALHFTILRRDRTVEESHIAVVNVETAETKIGHEEGFDPQYSPTGHLVYGLGGALRAVPFDLGRLEVTGAPALLVDGVATTSDGSAKFAVSREGALVFVSGPPLYAGGQMVWVYRDGTVESLPLETPPGGGSPRLSLDGKRWAAELLTENQWDIWTIDLELGTRQLITTDPASEIFSLWTPKGDALIFSSRRDGAVKLFRKQANGTGSVESLFVSSGRLHAFSWSADGAMLMFQEQDPETGFDIWQLPIGPTTGSAESGECVAQPLIHEPGNQTDPVVSPTGLWIAHESDESGQSEVHVDRFPDLGDRRTISIDGGSEPLWSPKGDEIFYRHGDAVMAVSILETETESRHGRPVELFSGSFAQNFGDPRHWDIHPDGDRFIMRERLNLTELRVVTGWFEELKARVPAP